MRFRNLFLFLFTLFLASQSLACKCWHDRHTPAEDWDRKVTKWCLGGEVQGEDQDEDEVFADEVFADEVFADEAELEGVGDEDA
ncbi:hypothetical protein N0V90_006312 [Kalmusia sp. IMI 367209]|nr:hypothetical protein N0V90_006312 [Kalmusia sp. IMI 367209]